MLQRIDGRELTEWHVLYTRVQPWGDYRDDLRAGEVAAAAANAGRLAASAQGAKLSSGNAKASDFFATIEGEVNAGMSIKDKLLMVAAAIGAEGV